MASLLLFTAAVAAAVVTLIDRRIGAHGVLADDMGLGKTLQSLMAVAICHHEHPGEREGGTKRGRC